MLLFPGNCLPLESTECRLQEFIFRSSLDARDWLWSFELTFHPHQAPFTIHTIFFDPIIIPANLTITTFAPVTPAFSSSTCHQDRNPKSRKRVSRSHSHYHPFPHHLLSNFASQQKQPRVHVSLVVSAERQLPRRSGPVDSNWAEAFVEERIFWVVDASWWAGKGPRPQGLGGRRVLIFLWEGGTVLMVEEGASLLRRPSRRSHRWRIRRER